MNAPNLLETYIDLPTWVILNWKGKKSHFLVSQQEKDSRQLIAIGKINNRNYKKQKNDQIKETYIQTKIK